MRNQYRQGIYHPPHWVVEQAEKKANEDSLLPTKGIMHAPPWVVKQAEEKAKKYSLHPTKGIMHAPPWVAAQAEEKANNCYTNSSRGIYSVPRRPSGKTVRWVPTVWLRVLKNENVERGHTVRCQKSNYGTA